MWIGGNDLCAVCKGHERNTPSEYARYIEEALDILATIPRTFVNLVSIIDVTRLYEVKEGNCVASHAIVCPCGTSPDDATRVETSLAFDDYVRLTHEIASRERFQSRDDFTVVVQPFFEDTQVPLRPDGTPDRSYFAPDCFRTIDFESVMDLCQANNFDFIDFTTKAHVAGGLSLYCAAKVCFGFSLCIVLRLVGGTICLSRWAAKASNGHWAIHSSVRLRSDRIWRRERTAP